MTGDEAASVWIIIGVFVAILWIAVIIGARHYGED